MKERRRCRGVGTHCEGTIASGEEIFGEEAIVLRGTRMVLLRGMIR